MESNKEIMHKNYVLCKKSVQAFVKIANGVYREHLSDQMLELMLCSNFMKTYTKDIRKDGSPANSVEDIAYTSSVDLFEVFLEVGCGVKLNGHHMAQKFASLFSIK